MFSMDSYGNVTCNVGDTILMDFTLKKEKLTELDKVEFNLHFNNKFSTKEYTPKDGIVKISLEPTEPGNGSYNLKVKKADGRQEITNIGIVKVN